jgi:hypothetical protein
MHCACPRCRAVLDVPADRAGQVLACPHCRRGFRAPDVPAAQPVVLQAPAERCYECGVLVPEGQVVRRWVQTGGGVYEGSTRPAPLHPLDSPRYSADGSSWSGQKVSLCQRCAREHDTEKAAGLWWARFWDSIGLALVVAFVVFVVWILWGGALALALIGLALLAIAVILFRRPTQ